MIVRIRSRDGLERVTLDGDATLADLRSAVAEQLKVPVDKQAISLNADLLRGEQGTVPCLEGDAPLSTMGTPDLVKRRVPGGICHSLKIKLSGWLSVVPSLRRMTLLPIGRMTRINAFSYVRCDVNFPYLQK